MRIDFHSNVADKINYTCRLIRKARAANCKMVVYHRDAAQLQRLDEALWTFSGEDFLPHVMLGDALTELTPVILSADDTAGYPHHELLINLSDVAPANFGRFERMIEIVSGEEQDTLAGRARYRAYQQQGHNLTHTVAK